MYSVMLQLYYHTCRDEADRKPSQLSGLALLEKTKENWKTMPQDSKVVWIEAAQKEEERYRVRTCISGNEYIKMPPDLEFSAYSMIFFLYGLGNS